MTTISASIIADSISPDGIRLTTMHLRYPRFIHAEFMTHRVFSRNARSSRAVPVETMLREIETDPVIPLHWGANQKGMQADRECEEPVRFRNDEVSREQAWLRARDNAVAIARNFERAGYHKQVVNRLLEPFMHIDVLVSGTEWANFLALRDHHMAEPHIAVLARAVRERMGEQKPAHLKHGEWHLPYVSQDDIAAVADRPYREAQAMLIKLSVARCARISYRPFDGNGSMEAEIARHDALVGATPMHASPAEHQATPDTMRGVNMEGPNWAHPHEHANLRGWRQYRKRLVGENQTEMAA